MAWRAASAMSCCTWVLSTGPPPNNTAPAPVVTMRTKAASRSCSLAGFTMTICTADRFGEQLHVVSAATAHEIEQVFTQLDQNRPDALVLNGDLLFTSERNLIVTLAARASLPTIYHDDLFVRAGGLISYGASTTAVYRQAGIYVGRILKGAKPADLPVILPTEFDLVINLKTAKVLGLYVPEPFVLYRADEVIE